MATKNETPNYTAEQVQAIIAAAPVTKEVAEKLARDMGKNVKSVIAKAVREGVYQAQEKRSKSGGPVESKEAIAAELATMLGVTASGIDKAPKEFLKAVRAALAARS